MFYFLFVCLFNNDIKKLQKELANDRHIIYNNVYTVCYLHRSCGIVVVKALYYNPEGLVFENRWIFFISQFICNLYTYIKYNQKIVCWEARAGRGVLCSTSPWLKGENLVWLSGKKGYKLRLTTKAYKLSYNYINYTINLVGRAFGKWRCRRLHSGPDEIN
jgi:hypothetical protein